MVLIASDPNLCKLFTFISSDSKSGRGGGGGG